MKKHDEIKTAMECCVIGPSANQPKCGECPYMYEKNCSDTFLKDALALAQQLEAQNAELLEKVEQLQAERDAAVADLEHVKDCDSCKYDDACFTGKKDCTPTANCKCWLFALKK